MSYGYDQDNDRIWSFDGVATSTSPTKSFSLTDTGTSAKHIFANDQLIATILNNSTSTDIYYVHNDHLGGTNVVSNQGGSVQQLIDYYPFGMTPEIRTQYSI